MAGQSVEGVAHQSGMLHVAGCVVSPAAAPPKTDARDNHTNTHIHTQRLPCQAGGRRSQEGSQSQCAAALKELSRTRKSLNKQQGAECTTPQLTLSLPLHLICLSSPSPARPLPYGALDRDANVTRTAAAHSHAPNFHYQMRTFIYKLFLFSCCFRFFLSFFFISFFFLLLSSFVSCVAFVALIFLAHIIKVASQVASLPLVARNFLLAISCISSSHLGNFSNPLFACGFL